MNILEARRRTLGADVYKKTATGNPVSVRSLARMRPGLKVFGKSEQFTTTGAQLIPFELNAEMASENGNTKCVPQKDGFHIELEIGSTAVADDDIYFLGSNMSTIENGYDEYENLPPGTYYGKISDPHYNLYVVVWREGSNHNIFHTNSSGTFTVQDGDKFRLFIRPMKLATSGTVKAIISKQDDSVMYEPYTGGKPSPSTDYPQEITSAGDDGSVQVDATGAQLFNITDGSGTKNGITVKRENGIITVTGTPISTTDYSVFNVGRATFGAGTYTISVDNKFQGIGIAFTHKPKGVLNLTMEGITAIKTGTLTSGSDNDYIMLNVDNTKGTLNYTGKFMFNAGSSALSWEPYKHTSAILSTPNGLSGIPVTSGGNYTDADGQQWVCDEVDFRRGKYVQRVKKEYLTGTPNFAETPDEPGRYLWTRVFKTHYKTAISVGISNFAKWTMWGLPHIAKAKGDVFCSNDTYLYYSPIDDDMTAEEVNAKFAEMIASDNPPYIIGQLATPIETDLSEEQMAAYANLHTNRPTTVVSATDGAGLELTYKTKKS